IAHNIAFGQPHEDKEAIERAAGVADVYKNIVEFPEGFSTLLGERGINLSGGQKQRVSIARAVIGSPRILVFDDCLSAVDTETEEHILTALREVMKGKTSVVIAHRISSVKHADRIIVLDKGVIKEEGTHESLLAHGGIYAKLYRRQLMEQQEAG
ncbi:MAG: ATP-binding cassette domain-containing protein, partial [Flavobacteriales bacterium]|nr:ATP-binding cassette domain-containing protein [Flavobacteriales bacterium]